MPSWILSLKKGKPNSTPRICTAICLPFVRQYASHLYGSTFEKVLGVGVTGKFPINLGYTDFPFQSTSRIALPSVQLKSFFIRTALFMDQPDLVMRSPGNAEGTSDLLSETLPWSTKLLHKHTPFAITSLNNPNNKIGIGIGKFPVINSQELQSGEFLTGQGRREDGGGVSASVLITDQYRYRYILA